MAASRDVCTAGMQVKTAEGFSKRELFEKLAPLEAATRPLMQAARQTLAKQKGQSALQPWNISYSLSGGIPSANQPRSDTALLTQLCYETSVKLFKSVLCCYCYAVIAIRSLNASSTQAHEDNKGAQSMKSLQHAVDLQPHVARSSVFS